MYSRRTFLETSLSGLAVAAFRPALAATAVGAGVPAGLLRRALSALERHGDRIEHRDIVGIADFSLPSYAPRFHLVTLATGSVRSHLVAHGRGSDPRRTGWLDLPLLRYSNMINGTGWLVVTKLDVLDELEEIPVCVGYRIDGKETVEIPAQASGYEKIEPIYTKLPGWQSKTFGIANYDQLPAKAKSYLAFIEKETTAKVGIVSTGPDREQTIFVDAFSSALDSVSGQ